MNTFIAAGILALLAQGPGSDPRASKPIALNFSQTDVSQIFRAIGMRTNTNIIYANAEKVPVTLHFNAANADEAIRGTASAAGLVFRQVGRFYVVAKPGGLRQALAPFAEKERIKTSDAVGMARMIQDLLPDATVTAGEGEIIVIGVLYDLKVAERIVADRPVQGKDPRIVDVVSVHTALASKIAPVLTDLYPSVKISVLSDVKGAGSIAILGLPDDVKEAISRALDLDSATGSATLTTVVEYYDVKYASTRVVVEFLKQVIPSLMATEAPAVVVPAVPNASGGDINTGVGLGSIKVTGNTGSVAAGGTNGATGGGATSGGTVTDPGGSGNGGGGGNATGGAVASAEGVYNPPTRIMLKGIRKDVDLALEYLSNVDRRPRQVTVEVRVVDASPSDLDKVGLDYTWDSLRFFEVGAGTLKANTDAVTKPVGLGQISRLPLGFTAALDLMVSKTDAKLLANPSIQVLDNQEADFFIGDQLSFPVTTGGALGTQNVTIERFQVGVALNVRPRVSPDGTVVMNINPIIQTLTGITNGLPQTSSREARTSVIVRDGETVVIGGLIRDEDTKTTIKIPFLGDVPIIGQLFRHTTRDHRRSNVIVTITPHIVPDLPIPNKEIPK